MMKKNETRQKFPWIMALILILILGAFTVGILGSDPGGYSPGQEEEPLEDQTASGLSAVLSGPAQVEACQAVPVEFTLTNQGEADIYLLTWYTPLEGIAGRIFRVTYQGRELDYLGILAMRGDPTPDQYIFLEAGDSTSTEVDLSPAFDFSRPGVYQIVYLSPWISFVGEDPDQLPESVDDLGPVKIPSEPIILEVLPSDPGENCVSVSPEEAIPSQSEPDLAVTGRVREVSPSLMMIWLEEEQGIDSIALSEETALLGEDGQELELIDIQPGMEIQASGQPGSEGVLIADQVVIQP